MKAIRNMAACLIGAALVVAGPAQANPASVHEAKQLRRLDIMLMVTNLRCRLMGEGFGADYARFSANHLRVMNAAGKWLRSDFGGDGSDPAQYRALDTISTAMANRYGQGHPWLDCADLRDAARNLAEQTDTTSLVLAAAELLADYPATQVAFDAGT